MLLAMATGRQIINQTDMSTSATDSLHNKRDDKESKMRSS